MKNKERITLRTNAAYSASKNDSQSYESEIKMKSSLFTTIVSDCTDELKNEELQELIQYYAHTKKPIVIARKDFPTALDHLKIESSIFIDESEAVFEFFEENAQVYKKTLNPNGIVISQVNNGKNLLTQQPVVIKIETLNADQALRNKKRELIDNEVHCGKKVGFVYSSGYVEINNTLKHYQILTMAQGCPLPEPLSSMDVKRFDCSTLTEFQKIDIVIKIVEKLKVLHFTHGVLHRDLYGDNIIVDKKNDGSIDVNFIDFGLSACLENSLKNGIGSYFGPSGDDIWHAINELTNNRLPRECASILQTVSVDISRVLNTIHSLNIKNSAVIECLITFSQKTKYDESDYDLIMQDLKLIKNKTDFEASFCRIQHKMEKSMQKTLILNYIMADGVGDYKHYQDIENALSNNPKIGPNNLFSIICFEIWDKNDTRYGHNVKYAHIEKNLSNLHSQYFFGCKSEIENYFTRSETQELLKSIDQVIIISVDFKGYLSQKIKPYLKKGVPIKCIFEHERLTFDESDRIFPLKNQSSSSGFLSFWQTPHQPTTEHPVLIRSLGLSPGTRGIKLQSLPCLTPTEAWDVIFKNDQAFAEKILDLSHSNNLNQFMNTHALIPAYINNAYLLGPFMRFLDQQNDYFQNKNIVIYLSCSNYDGMFKPYFQKYFQGINRGIELHDIKRNEIKPVNQGSASQKIIIITGVYLSDASFNAVYDLSKIVYVSGDTSLEFAISKGKLPFYRSTNHGLGKYLTIDALKNLTEKQELGLTVTERNAFQIYFDTTMAGSFELGKENPYELLYLEDLIQGWPKFASYLKQHHNFYNQLEDIFFENPAVEQQKSFISSIQSYFNL